MATRMSSVLSFMEMEQEVWKRMESDREGKILKEEGNVNHDLHVKEGN